ncbi:hypothetical protein C0Q70_02504 [Pomacea canaliculata]|uniref:Poly [ADP-ribose] polymerase n=1 Tax=Pomacea canaliculata TaxID=400727 RepID=A0A2T7PQ39_POMCA|nr:hypothetical protein C0Q70_02504 [Pomacea canaliculata]
MSGRMGSLQYTLEEKYLKGQHKYYLEFEELSVMVDTHSSPMTQTNLDTQASTRIVRSPVFVSHEQPDAPRISPLLLPEAPKLLLHRVPEHWTAVDRFQNFELVELNSTHPEYVNVHRQRAMTPKDWSPEDVDERQLFHGTPTLQASRGICTNSFDFRRSGENVGAVLGKGAYFSTTA